MSRKKAITIYDIAAYCSVSPATVSRVLGASDYPVSEKTRRKVLAAAEALEYTAVAAAPRKADAPRSVGVILPNISNPHHVLLAQGIQLVAHERGYQTILCSSARNIQMERRNIELLIDKKVNGLLLVSLDDTGSAIGAIARAGIPFVAMEQHVNHDCNRTCFDFEQGARLAVEHLLECGHSRIGFVSPPLCRAGSRKRLLESYRAVLSAHGIQTRDDYAYIGQEETDWVQDYEGTVGKSAVDALLLLDKPPTALFCVNDMIAIGAIRRLKERGLNVPKDMAVVGFDNIALSAMMTPAITTIEQSGLDLGRISADLLIKNIEQSHAAPAQTVTIQLDPRLIVRETTKLPG